MRFSTSSVLLAAASLLGSTLSHNIQLAAHGRECFHEVLHKDDKMTVTFQVGDREFGSAGNLHVDFWVRRVSSPLLNIYLLQDRFKTQPEATSRTRSLFPMEIIPLRQSMTGNTCTASATNTGRHQARTFPSMYTA
jgi:hypothetical protein